MGRGVSGAGPGTARDPSPRRASLTSGVLGRSLGAARYRLQGCGRPTTRRGVGGCGAVRRACVNGLWGERCGAGRGVPARAGRRKSWGHRRQRRGPGRGPRVPGRGRVRGGGSSDRSWPVWSAMVAYGATLPLGAGGGGGGGGPGRGGPLGGGAGGGRQGGVGVDGVGSLAGIVPGRQSAEVR